MIKNLEKPIHVIISPKGYGKTYYEYKKLLEENKEIKEILEFLKPIENRTCATLGSKKCELLLDYITNLQEENKEVNRLWEKTYVIIRNDKELAMNENTYNYLINKETIIDKAIEYIEENICNIEYIKKKYNRLYVDIETSSNEINDILNILKGEDNE